MLCVTAWAWFCLTTEFVASLRFGLYKILFHFKALVRESIILLLPPPPHHLQRLRYCNTIAHPLRNIRSPPTPDFHAIHHAYTTQYW